MHLSIACPRVPPPPPPRRWWGFDHGGGGVKSIRKSHFRDRGNGHTAPPRGREHPVCWMTRSIESVRGTHRRSQYRLTTVDVPHPRNPPHGTNSPPRVKRCGQIPHCLPGGIPGLAIDRRISFTLYCHGYVVTLPDHQLP